MDETKEIETKEEFDGLKHHLNSTVDALLNMSDDLECSWDVRSSELAKCIKKIKHLKEMLVQTHTKQFEEEGDSKSEMDDSKSLIDDLENHPLKFGIMRFSVHKLVAFLFSRSIEMLPRRHFAVFKNILTQIQGFKIPEQCEEIYKTMSLKTSLPFPLSHLTSLVNMYRAIKPSLQEQLSDKNLSDSIEDVAIKDFKGYKGMSLLLEDLCTRLQAPYTSLGDLQNELVEHGLWLKTEGHPSFFLGAQYTLMQMLNAPRAALLSAFVVHKLGRHLNVFSEEELRVLGFKSKDMVIEALQKEYHSFLDIGNKHPSLMMLPTCRHYSDALRAIQNKYRLSHKDLYEWLRGIYDIGVFYEYYRALANLKQKPEKLRILLLGDSISAGFGIEDPKKRWVNILRQILKDRGLDCEIVNASVPGFTTQHGLLIVKDELAGFQPDIVLTTLGGNDIFAGGEGSSVFQIKGNIRKITDICMASPSVIAVVWGCGVPETFQEGKAFMATLEETLKLTAEEVKQEMELRSQINCSYQSKFFHPIFIGEEIMNKENILEDGIHLKISAQKPLADFACKQLQSPILRVKQIKVERQTRIEPKDQRSETKSDRGPLLLAPRRRHHSLSMPYALQREQNLQILQMLQTLQMQSTHPVATNGLNGVHGVNGFNRLNGVHGLNGTYGQNGRNGAKLLNGQKQDSKKQEGKRQGAHN